MESTRFYDIIGWGEEQEKEEGGQWHFKSVGQAEASPRKQNSIYHRIVHKISYNKL